MPKSARKNPEEEQDILDKLAEEQPIEDHSKVEDYYKDLNDDIKDKEEMHFGTEESRRKELVFRAEVKNLRKRVKARGLNLNHTPMIQKPMSKSVIELIERKAKLEVMRLGYGKEVNAKKDVRDMGDQELGEEM